MSNPPSAKSILHLYASTLRTCRTFSSYNFREYFLRRTKSTFREIQKEQDPVRLAALYNESVKELAVLKRGAIVNQLYGGWTLAVEKQNIRRERSDG
ncbi:hypothetical protein F5148DRAFT_1206661 [Russula earlei]|uniref:Uncharacterized protein n=1 Tax=Russula earlei TaxID=71964 RepID=A0ACC0U7P2_9AGAM|nr:hypothetical protein F5148DRAFT_1206661 [Russula earlei]